MGNTPFQLSGHLWSGIQLFPKSQVYYSVHISYYCPLLLFNSAKIPPPSRPSHVIVSLPSTPSFSPSLLSPAQPICIYPPDVSKVVISFRRGN